MYQLATCRATIMRGTVPNEFGDPSPSMMPVQTNVLASINEEDKRVWENSTQTPRIARIVTGYFPYGTDLQVNDRVRDDSHDGITYWVVDVQTIRIAAIRPDLQATLRRVGTS
ncbi:hypothetical protein AB0383_20605 [Amycolatopsis sp. NPDC051373]|uniref:hypothetical protein n=1 Tax=Amycolatopsis sp. NPDC051373 TaxID=3155801 RepID=UPI00344B38D8